VKSLLQTENDCKLANADRNTNASLIEHEYNNSIAKNKLALDLAQREFKKYRRNEYKLHDSYDLQYQK